MKAKKMIKQQRVIALIFLTGFIISCSSEEPVPALIVEFEADNLVIFEGESIQFTDLSDGNPTEWKWTFEGGTPSTSDQQNPQVMFDEDGIYDVTLEVKNAGHTEVVTKPTYIKVNCSDAYCLSQYEVVRHVGDSAYGINPEMHLFEWFEPVGTPQTDRPMVVLAGGGNFSSGSNLDLMEPLASLISSYGIVVATIKY